MPDLPALNSGVAILILAAGDDFENIPPGATGLISPEEPPEALFAAIRQVARGEQYISPALAVSLLHQRSVDSNDNPNLTLLSEREAEILDLLALGQGNKSIAAQLYLSVRTVEGHLASIYAKLGVHSRSEAMLIAMRSR
jgi:DNA-binding NarL/FixJ family response regulator